MNSFTLSKLAVTVSFLMSFGAAVIVAPQPGYADSSTDPCESLTGRDLRDCEAENNHQDRQMYLEGYRLAKQEKFVEALRLFHKIKNQDNPAVLTYIGYSMRKLGYFDAALVYYKKALEISPNLPLTRSYLGQAYLRVGIPEKADEQLAKISQQCGTSCKGYALLERAIADYKTKNS